MITAKAKNFLECISWRGTRNRWNTELNCTLTRMQDGRKSLKSFSLRCTLPANGAESKGLLDAERCCRERDVGIICVIIYDGLALEAWTQRKGEREGCWYHMCDNI